MTKRERIYSKFGGKCAYTGQPLEDDWQIDHMTPKYLGGDDDDGNYLPSLRIVNWYKHSLTLEKFRAYMMTFHERLKTLPKNPKSESTIRRKNTMLSIASAFKITKDKPFSGIFYFEKK